MTSLKVLVVVKFAGDASSSLEKKYALVFDAASNPTVSDLTRRLQKMQDLADPVLRLIDITTEDEHFGTINCDGAEPLVDLRTYSAIYTKKSSKLR